MLEKNEESKKIITKYAEELRGMYERRLVSRNHYKGLLMRFAKEIKIV